MPSIAKDLFSVRLDLSDSEVRYACVDKLRCFGWAMLSDDEDPDVNK